MPAQPAAHEILLVGPPGTGETFTARALAGELSQPRFAILRGGVITKLMGETAAKLPARLRRAPAHARLALLETERADVVQIVSARGSSYAEIVRVCEDAAKEAVLNDRRRGDDAVFRLALILTAARLDDVEPIVPAKRLRLSDLVLEDRA